MEIVLGLRIAKPVQTAEECKQYATVANAINAHNAVCAPGQTLWGIRDMGTHYEVVENGAKETPKATPEEQLAALQTAQEDTDTLLVDQEYRLTLLELGITE